MQQLLPPQIPQPLTSHAHPKEIKKTLAKNCKNSCENSLPNQLCQNWSNTRYITHKNQPSHHQLSNMRRSRCKYQCPTIQCKTPQNGMCLVLQESCTLSGTHTQHFCLGLNPSWGLRCQMQTVSHITHLWQTNQVQGNWRARAGSEGGEKRAGEWEGKGKNHRGE